MEMSGAGDPEESTVNVAVLGAAIGVALPCFLALLTCIVVVALLVKRKRRRGRRGEWTLPGLDTNYNGKKALHEGMTNAIYTG